MDPRKNDEFLNKEHMIEKLGEYENLIKAIGALQFTSKYMQNTVPLVF